MNPNFILMKILNEQEFKKKFGNSTKKIVSAEQIYRMNSWYNVIKLKWQIKNKSRFLV